MELNFEQLIFSNNLFTLAFVVLFEYEIRFSINIPDYIKETNLILFFEDVSTLEIL